MAAGRSASQALHLCKVQFPMLDLRLAAGQCRANVAILLVGHAILQLRTLAARSMPLWICSLTSRWEGHMQHCFLHDHAKLEEALDYRTCRRAQSDGMHTPWHVSDSHRSNLRHLARGQRPCSFSDLLSLSTVPKLYLRKLLCLCSGVNLRQACSQMLCLCFRNACQQLAADVYNAVPNARVTWRGKMKKFSIGLSRQGGVLR